MYVELIGLWYDVVDDGHTPAMAIAHAGVAIHNWHIDFHERLNNTDFEPYIPYWDVLSISI